MDARAKAAQLLQAEGISVDDAAARIRAKDNFDRRLIGLGLRPLEKPPVPIAPGESLGRDSERAANALVAGIESAVSPRGAWGAASSVLLDPRGAAPDVEVIPSSFAEESEAVFEPSDLIAAQAVTGLATTAAGGTEVRFNEKGVVHVGSGAIGAYWNRPLGAAGNFRWAPLAPNLLLPYDPRQGLFVGTSNAGGITVGGVLTLAFYKLPPIAPRHARRRAPPVEPGRRPGDGLGDPGAIDPGGSAGGGLDFNFRDNYRFRSAGDFRLQLAQRLTASGSDNTAGAIIAGLGGGADVTLGSFSDAGVGTQIYLAGSNLPVGGASVAGEVVLNAPPTNTDAIWVGETAAKAVASNGGISASGQDKWNIPAGGKLFMLANSGTQILGARYRS